MINHVGKWLFLVTAATVICNFTAARADSLLIAAGNAVEEYTTSGSFAKTFVASGGGGLSSPGNLTFGLDGNLYVTSGGDGTIKEYNGQTGAFLGDFATGLPGAIDIAFDSLGRAYVAQYGTNQVSQLSATGALLQTFTSMLSTPEGLTLTTTASRNSTEPPALS